MPELYVNPLERPDLALSNALAGNPQGAVRSLFSPDSLSPTERQTISERYFGNTDPGPVGEILKYTTNPTVIAAAIMTFRYPIATSLADIDPTRRPDAYLRGQMRKLLPLYDYIAPFNELFAGTPLPDIVQELSTRKHEVNHEASQILANAYNKYFAASGESGIPTEVQHKVVAALGDYTNPTNEIWDTLREAYKDSPSELNKINRLINQMGNAAPRLTPAEAELANDVRRFYQYTWDKAGTDAPGVVDALKRKVASKGGPGVPGEFRENYWRHLAHKSPGEAEKQLKGMVDQILSGGKGLERIKILGNDNVKMTPSDYNEMLNVLVQEYPDKPLAELEKLSVKYADNFLELKKAATSPTAKIASNNMLARFGKMLPNSDFLRGLGGPFEGLAEYVDNAVLPDPINGNELRAVRQFRTDFKVLDTTAHETARNYAFSVIPEGAEESLGKRLSTVANAVGKDDPVRMHMLKDTYIPGIYQDTTYEEMVRSQWLHNVRSKAADVMESAAAQKYLPSEFRERTLKALREAPPLGNSKVLSGLTSLMYSSTLALPNIISPLKNLAQTVITTYPTIGLKHTMAGVQETVSRYNKFFDLKLNQGLSYEEAAAKSFGSFHATPFDYDEGMRSLLSTVEDPLRKAKRGTTAYAKLVAKAKPMMMSAFLATERFNRMVAFYGGRNHAVEMLKGQEVLDPITGKYTKLPGKVAQEILDDPKTSNSLARIATLEAEKIVKSTQFAGGITNAPYTLTKVPALGKMLLNFPLQFLSFATRGGWGRLARIGLGTTAAVAGASALLGTEGERQATQATFAGALPLPDENHLFAPWPLVPPIAQIGGAAVSAVTTGDTSHLRRSLPLLVPGGVGLSRAVGTNSETVGKFLGKNWADYDNPLPDGRIGLYNPSGALVGYYTRNQLIGRSMGLGDLNGAQDQALTKWMIKHGERVANIRRQYLDARANNDMRAADRAEREYQKMYPGLGDIPIKKSHLRALHMRRDVARTERVLENMPSDIRGQFGAAISTAFAARGPGYFGLQPGTNITQGSTIRDRDPYRLRQAGLQNEEALLTSSFLDRQGLGY